MRSPDRRAGGQYWSLTAVLICAEALRAAWIAAAGRPTEVFHRRSCVAPGPRSHRELHQVPWAVEAGVGAS